MSWNNFVTYYIAVFAFCYGWSRAQSAAYNSPIQDTILELIFVALMCWILWPFILYSSYVNRYGDDVCED